MKKLAKFRSFAVATVVAFLFSICTVATTAFAADNTSAVAPHFKSVTVEKSGSQYKIAWENVGDLGKVSVYASTNPNTLYSSGTALGSQTGASSATSGSITVADPSSGARTYFLLVSANGAKIIGAERWLPFTGIANARDLGGYVTTSGRIVKWGILYRTAQLGKATDADKSYLQSLGIKTIIDLRATSDRVKSPEVDIDGIKGINMNVWGDDMLAKMMPLFPDFDWAGFAAAAKDPSKVTPELSKQWLTMCYKFFVNGDAPHKAANDFFTFMASNNDPVIWHCSEGKDRTGLTAALLLYTLGVPEDSIMKDFLLTNEGMKVVHPKEAKAMPEETFNIMFGVDPSYLPTAFNEIKAKYGSIDGYLSTVCGVTPQVKKALIEKYTAFAPTYMLTFMTNGGNTLNPVNMNGNEPASNLAAPIRTGYTFAGWYTDAALTQAFSSSTVITSDTMLYAKWVTDTTSSTKTGDTSNTKTVDTTNPKTGDSSASNIYLILMISSTLCIALTVFRFKRARE